MKENHISEETEPIQGRYSADSLSEQVHILTMANMNGASRLFGGDLQDWMDETAAVAARRHASKVVTTACIEHFRFLRPAYQNDMLIIHARVIYTGHTSIEVLATAEVEAFDGSRTLIADGHYILVALDGEGHSSPVPPLIPVGEEEERLFAEAQARRCKS